MVIQTLSVAREGVRLLDRGVGWVEPFAKPITRPFQEHDGYRFAPPILRPWIASLALAMTGKKFLGPSFRGTSQTRTSDVQLHIGESLDSGFDASRLPSRRYSAASNITDRGARASQPSRNRFSQARSITS